MKIMPSGMFQTSHFPEGYMVGGGYRVGGYGEYGLMMDGWMDR